MWVLIAKYRNPLFLLISALLIGFSTFAKNYYVSNSGNDSNDGLSISTPWKSLAKVSSFTSLTAGDSVLFNCGDIFYGTLIINNSGSSANPITIGAYGTGANPVITGFTTISDWTSLGNNIWESTNAVSALTTCNMVTVNGINTAMGRYPNKGYLTYQSFTSSSITSNSLNSSITNWTGAIVAIRKNNWIIDRDTIKSQSGTVLTHSQHSIYNGTTNYGFFIENDSRTLDTANEWYYNALTKKIMMYSTSMPANVQVSSIDSLVKMNGRNNITFTNISFIGSNIATFSINFSHHPKILNCYIDFAGINAIITRGGSCDSAKIINCNINHSNNKAIDLGGASPNCLISYTTIKNTGMIPGMGASADGTYTGVVVNSDNSIVENCFVDSTGYIGIGFYGNNTIIRNNFVTNYCQVKHDGGGLYTFISVGGTPFTGEQLLNNTVMNGNSSTEGTTETVAIIHGIYLDEGTGNIEVSGNTAANSAYGGIYIHNAYNLNIHNNTSFDNGLYQVLFASFATGSQIRNNIVNNNIFVSKDSSQLVASFQSVTNDISSFGTIDSNYYARPIDDNVDLYITINNYTNFFHYTLAQWQAYAGFDAHSHKSPKTMTTLNDLRLEYNTTSVNKTVSLDGYYVDVKNVSYNGTIILAPYASAVLIRNTAPTANAGADQLITLPTNTVILSGSGTDPDGSISSYNWTEISGPAPGIITNGDSASISVTGMVQGVYQFELKVTDNNGATARDTMLVTLNVPPIANAGTDQLITSPTSTVTLSGSGTDPDGTIATYSWTRISGPAGGTITNPSSAVTSVTGLVQGVYQFELDVTDNRGATGLDTVQITVNAPPIANAGTDQLITLPISTVTLSGSGTDFDGTIVSYNWTEISGPGEAIISNPAFAIASVTGLVQGVYQFELDVTDNNGAIGSASVQITVNAANIPPTANAGADQLITLPTSSVTLSGSGTDPDGTIATYSWTRISGPAGGTITNPSSAVTSVTGLVQGVYQFELDVTDNRGATGLDTVQITVNAPPTANAGADQLITLPTSSVTLSGSGTDADGTISAYSWTKLSGSPSSGIITNPSSAVTSVTGLVQGVYQFELDVTDNSGATGLDTVQITVNAPPTANAGTDQSITLPTSTVTLSGSGTDADGTISAYSWTKLSGSPSSGIITNPSSAVTSVTGLVQGVYQFELDVTDNSGATGLDTVQITVNAPPTANAGTDQSITLPTSTVTLSGRGTDADGTISAYSWTKLSGSPSSGIITNPSSAVTSVTGLVQGVYQFELDVTDNSGATGLDTVQITVNAANIPPTANAGTDQLITLPISTATLLGSGTDPDGTIAAYSWTRISGPAGGTITNPSSAVTSVTGLVQGVYQFELKVTDNNGATGKDTIQVIVNVPPTANAGADQLITLPISTATLSGSGTDPDGTISTYSWTKLSGSPSSGTITSPASASTTVTALVQGVYQFELKVTDNNGATGKDTIQVIVNVPPTANAGIDQLITLPISTATLSGSGTDADGTISAYSWTKLSGSPSSGTITSPASASTTITALVQGVYQFELKVTDNNGATGKDTMQVIVNAPPTANAGIDQLITLPTSSVTLSGSGTDADGTISAYSWTKLSGSPSSGTITSPASASTTITALVQGVYQFELKVTDNNGATGKDTIQVIVNVPPTANAGADQLITLPISTATLSGSGTDPDGTISTYSWTKLSGSPSSGTITSPASASTTVTTLVQGVYQFELKVTDNNGATGKDTMQVIVNAPPTANAGIDQLITLPTSSLTLSGSGTDADGTISAYSWTKLSGSPSSGTITSPASASTTVTALVQGVYKFQLKVTDNRGATGLDTVQITVNAPPTANAGADQLITLPISTATLSGSGTDPDGTISTYSWTKLSGSPSSGTITSPASASTTVTTLVQGVYQFELKVTDNNGATGKDTMQVIVNAPPTANAGIDQLITLPTSSLTLSGNGTDADGTISAYSWTKLSGSPSSGTITSPASASTTVTALVQGVYKFQLKVTDNRGATGLDTVQITVNAPPTANAGADQLITLPTSSVTLSGSGTDADGTISAYSWTKLSGSPSSGTITSPASASTTVTALVQGVYKFQLKVTDNRGATGLDTVQITVNAPPTANAGADQLITLPTSSVTLSGSGTDTDGTISAYSWTKLSGSPSSGTITSPASASTTITALVQGVYKFQLKVTDNRGATGLDTVQITVNAPPTANAGADQLITLPTSSVTLSGSGTDADGTISAYSWTKLSGSPSSGTITSPASASTTITALVQGVYKFQLKVTDNRGATGLDTVQITVNAPPTANAGADQLITLPTSSVTLSGSGTDADGTISAYSWTKLSGSPSSGTITSPASASTTITALVQGVYKFQLKVTDNRGATGLDTVQITVNAPPTANAGADQLITLPTSSVTLSGSGTDPDGTISAYTWAKIAGPAATIARPNSKITSVTGLLQGVYKFQLTVTDNKGATGKDTVQVTVNPAALGANLVTFVAPRISDNVSVVYQNVPNPFSNITTIYYEVPVKSLVKIVVFNTPGIPVAVLANEIKNPGSYQVQWNAGNITSGTYFYTIIIGDNVRTKKMLKLN